MLRRTNITQEMLRIISINKSNKVFSDRAVRNCGPIFWNSLNNEIKRCKNTKEFRNSLKKHLLSNYS